MKYLGIDYGTKRIGIAISNEEGTLAFPYGIFANTAQFVEELKKVVNEESVQSIVIGESLHLDGVENEIMSAINVFAEKLEKEFGLPVHFQEERLSSVAAKSHLYGKGNIANERWTGKGNQEKRTSADDSAAAIILQRYLDSKKELN
ncbi:Holliday junction resolvase RuvX [Patescibacteria group bacterium]|nr:Holliday junction resolvase RuvX [Patescibacteria group bacterium]